jgi:hypothetical protein
VSVGPEPQLTVQQAEQARQIKRLVEEIIRLSEQDLPPDDYYREFLKRVLFALEAPAGAVWIRNPQGHFPLQYQINAQQVGLDKSEEGRRSHAELIRAAAFKAQPIQVPPRSSAGPTDNDTPAPGNPTDYFILLVPILVDKQVAGLLEIFQDPRLNPNALRNQTQFMIQVTALATVYTRNHRLRQMVGQEKLWTQLEAFTRQIHATLNPTEVSYMVANEARRLVECDRISVGLRYGKKAKVEAISGADTVEKRSNLVQLMRTLFQRVLVWGEKLIYTGVKDDTLPPDVLDALDNYLAESNSKLLVLTPLKDERESESKKPARSAILMECFDPSSTPDQLVARLEVVGRHATSALYNAVEHRRIPMRFIWMPIAKVQEGLGGKARAITYSVIAAVVLLIGAMILVPYPLKMKAKGNMLPLDRQNLFSPAEAQIMSFMVEPNDDVLQGQHLVRMRSTEVQMKITELNGKILAAKHDRDSQNDLYNKATDEKNRNQALAQRGKAEDSFNEYTRELNHYVERIKADPSDPGIFLLTCPLDKARVLSYDFRDSMLSRSVKPSEPIMRLGNVEGEWVIEIKMPQKYIGHVKEAFEKEQTDKLDVTIIPLSTPTRRFQGKLHRDDVAGEAIPNPDDKTESEPVVRCKVRIEDKDIPESDRMPRDLLFAADAEAEVKIDCGNRPMGYSLFHGAWEWFYEKVVFFF